MNENTTFFSMAKEFGICRILLSWDLFFWLLIAICIILFKGLLGFNISAGVFEAMLSVSTALFGLLFAAFAIVISLSDAEFVKVLKKAKVFHKLIFPFWYVSILYLTAIILVVLLLIIAEAPHLMRAYQLLEFITLFFIFYSLFATFYRISSAVKFGVYRAKLIDEEPKKGCSNVEQSNSESHTD